MRRLIMFFVAILLTFSIVFTTSCADMFPPQGTDSGENTSGNQETNDRPEDDENTGNEDEENTPPEDNEDEVQIENPALTRPVFDPTTIPVYNNSKSYVELNNNVPYFTNNQIVTNAYEYYSPLDNLGRCQVAVACLGRELMPTSERGSISSVSPTGWHGNSIYERSHLIAFALAGEDANKLNLITGTYDLNGEMQKFEALVLDYIKETSNHVMYRVEPVFTQNNLVAIGVIMEAYSVEDQGEGVSFNIFIYNAQDDIVIDYATGDYVEPESAYTYIVHKTKFKIHKPDCTGVRDMKDENKVGTTLTLEELVAQLTREGKSWSYCGTCKPQNG